MIAEGIESEQILSFVHSAEVTSMSHEPPIKGGQGFLLGKFLLPRVLSCFAQEAREVAVLGLAHFPPSFFNGACGQ